MHVICTGIRSSESWEWDATAGAVSVTVAATGTVADTSTRKMILGHVDVAGFTMESPCAPANVDLSNAYFEKGSTPAAVISGSKPATSISTGRTKSHTNKGYCLSVFSNL